MKNLTNCTPTEFMTQTNRIRKSVEKWLKDTDILNIRQRHPDYEVVKAGASADEKKAVIERNAQKEREQIQANFNAILNAIMDDHPQETLEVLALCAFIEPADIDNHTVAEFLDVFNDIVNNESVLNFFTSLARLAQMNTSNVSKA